MPVVETEFLSGLRKSDRRHQLVTSILERARKGGSDIVIAGSAITELTFGLRGKLGKEKVIQVLEIIEGVTSSIPVLELDMPTLLNGLKMEILLDNPNLFDCLHAAAALKHDGIIISSDSFYDTITGLRRMDFKEYPGKVQEI